MANRKVRGSHFRARMSPAERRAQLLEVASHLLFERGVEAVRIPEIAHAAGVTRPVVYRFFPSRQAVFVALLEDLGESLDRHLSPLSSRRGATEAQVGDFVHAICDAIEACGPGAWVLLGGAALDDEVRVVVSEVEERLTRPWTDRVARALENVDAERVRAVTAILVASSRAVLRLWIQGAMDRDAAAVMLTRSVRATLSEFRVARTAVDGASRGASGGA